MADLSPMERIGLLRNQLSVDKAPIPTAKIGGESLVEISMVSAARTLTKTSAQKKSDGTQRLRGGDRLYRYIDMSGTIEVPWGV